jgi:hypothetical protein
MSDWLADRADEMDVRSGIRLQDLVLALAEVPPQQLPGVDIRGDNEAGDLPLSMANILDGDCAVGGQV